MNGDEYSETGAKKACVHEIIRRAFYDIATIVSITFRGNDKATATVKRKIAMQKCFSM